MRLLRLHLIVFSVAILVAGVVAQAPDASPASKYLDQNSGMSAGDLVQKALENNGELRALQSEVDAANALISQAKLRSNPTLTVSGAKQLGGPDNNQMAEVMLPLELGRRRAARVAVAQRELDLRELALAERRRQLAVEIRLKFGEALAAILRLQVIERSVTAAERSLSLIVARVAEGKIAPLDEGIFQVELNRLRSLRETSEGKVEVFMLELRNLTGMNPEEPLRLRGDLDVLKLATPPLGVATADALGRRPDLAGARATEDLALARIEQAKSEGRIDAGVTAGYQRMNSGFPLSGYDDLGMLRPIQETFRFFTFGVEIMLPVRNRNQGAVAAATFEREAARRRIEFGELTIRREVTVAFARYARAAKALSIFENGVRDQARANLDVIWQTYELGSRSLLDYLTEERRFLEVELEVIDAQMEAYQAHVEILRSYNAPELTSK